MAASACERARRVPSGQRGERRADLRVERAVAPKISARFAACLSVVELLGLRSATRLGIGAQAEVERERRRAGARLRGGGDVARVREHAEHDHTRGDDRREGDHEERATPRAHGATIAVGLAATLVTRYTIGSVTTYRELLQAARAAIEEVDATGAQALLASDDAPVLVDVRERDEWDQGRIPGAVHIPRGQLESRIEPAAPDRSRPMVLYCSAGNRSAFAAKTLEELGYERPISLAGGFTDWKRYGPAH